MKTINDLCRPDYTHRARVQSLETYISLEIFFFFSFFIPRKSNPFRLVFMFIFVWWVVKIKRRRRRKENDLYLRVRVVYQPTCVLASLMDRNRLPYYVLLNISAEKKKYMKTKSVVYKNPSRYYM